MKRKKVLAGVLALLIACGSFGMPSHVTKPIWLRAEAIDEDIINDDNSMVDFYYNDYYITLNITVTGGNAKMIVDEGDYFRIVELNQGTTTLDDVLYGHLEMNEYCRLYKFCSSNSYFDEDGGLYSEELESGITVKVNYAVVRFDIPGFCEARFSGTEAENLINRVNAISDDGVVKYSDYNEFLASSDYLYGKGLSEENYYYSDNYNAVFDNYNGTAEEITIPCQVCLNVMDWSDSYEMTSVNKISYGAFSEAPNIKRVNLPESIAKIEDFALGYRAITDENGDTIYKKIDGFVIAGYSDSAAEAYALNNDITFVSLGERTDSPLFLYNVLDYDYDEDLNEGENATIEIIGYNGCHSEVEIPERYDGYIVKKVDWNIFKNHKEITKFKLSTNQMKNLEEQQAIDFAYDHHVGYYMVYNNGEYDDGTNSNLTFIGPENSVVEKYAKLNGFNFESNGDYIDDKFVYSQPNTSEDSILLDYYLGANSKVVIPSYMDGYKVVGIERYGFLYGEKYVTDIVFPDNKDFYDPQYVEAVYGSCFLGTGWEQNLNWQKNKNGSLTYKVNDYFNLTKKNAYYSYYDPDTISNAEKLGDCTYIISGNAYMGYYGTPISNEELLSRISEDDSRVSILGEGSIGWYGYGSSYDEETGEMIYSDTIKIPDGTEYISQNAIFDAYTGWIYNIKKIDLPSSLLGIETGWITRDKTVDGIPFNRLLNLSNIKLPSNLNYLGDGAFLIDHYNTEYTTGNDGFEGELMKSITLPKKLESIGKYAVGYQVITYKEKVTDSEGNEYEKDCYYAEKIPDFKIYCYEGTAGEQYAIENGFDYILLDDSIDSVSGMITAVGVTETSGMEITVADSEGIEYEATILADGTYSLPALATGEYKLTANAENCAPRTYSITVDEQTLGFDVELHLYGDVNADGKISVSDVAKVNSHIKGKSTLTDYDFAVADVNGDGKLTVSDTAKINAHMRGKSSLWI